MQRTSRNLSPVIILVLMGLVVVFVASCTTNNAHTAIDSIHDHTEENENVRKDPMDEVEDTAVASDTGDRESWIGKYREYICVYDHKSKKAIRRNICPGGIHSICRAARKRGVPFQSQLVYGDETCFWHLGNR